MSEGPTPTELRIFKRILVGVAIVIVVLFAGLMFGIPYYNVWWNRLAGEAELAHAEFSKKVAVETAKAKAEAAELEAKAEIARAKGVAEANKIIGDSLKGNESYLRYLWITSLEHVGDKTVVYVPTESNLPILEAHRFGEQGK